MVKRDEIRRGVGEKLGEETKKYDREEKVTSSAYVWMVMMMG